MNARKTIKLSGNFGLTNEISEACDALQAALDALSRETPGSPEYFAANANVKTARNAHDKLMKELRNKHLSD